ncbi:NAD(P)-binding protein [Eremomyces bilateralis CBS 781.70]|uniref:NAD(P)-binding protein n=1 Tax=Eremomyces bilateralis CBS 781.70 TaxID=1392243 RepID=A0A6G1G6Z9_9PEZI|nr:NAD(P)-binding protein [Eremomyces bilateralis CBS 781.70]KAF1813792.1 NAD(P)-binding protein [Eremomyces bilateralis CBS 781.70]
MASSLTEKVFIVTGSASGMGLATAKILLSRGASLGLCDLNGSSLEKVVHNLESDQKKRVLAEPIDIADRSAVASFIQTTKKHFGRLDGVANIAGVAGHKLGNETVWETTDEEFEHIIGVNVKGLFHVLGESLNPGVLEEFGSVVHISSMFSMRGYPKGAVFSASKHAAIGMVKSAAIEAGERNIRVNAVMP